jgi:hypothetical protein
MKCRISMSSNLSRAFCATRAVLRVYRVSMTVRCNVSKYDRHFGCRSFHCGCSFGDDSKAVECLRILRAAQYCSDDPVCWVVSGASTRQQFSRILWIGLIIYRLRTKAPVRKEMVLTLLASCPMMYAAVKRWF